MNSSDRFTVSTEKGVEEGKKKGIRIEIILQWKKSFVFVFTGKT